jgi:hypothetical protein
VAGRLAGASDEKQLALQAHARGGDPTSRHGDPFSRESGQELDFPTGDKGSWLDDGPGDGPHRLTTAGDAEGAVSGIQYAVGGAGGRNAAVRGLAAPTTASAMAGARAIGVLACVCQSRTHAPTSKVRSRRHRLRLPPLITTFRSVLHVNESKTSTTHIALCTPYALTH